MTQYSHEDLITESVYSILKVIAENNQFLDLNLLKKGLENALYNLHMNDDIIKIIEKNKDNYIKLQNDFIETEEDTKILFPTPFDEIISSQLSPITSITPITLEISDDFYAGDNKSDASVVPTAPTFDISDDTFYTEEKEDLILPAIPPKMYTKFNFNDGQQIIFDFMKHILESDKKVFAINGPAGTGKTTLVNCILNYFYEEIDIASTAPTHKAVEVIKGKLYEFDMNPEEDNSSNGCLKVGTIHSFLKLKKSTQYEGEDEGKVQFVPDTNPKLKSLKVDLLFVDESSMIGNQIRKMINLLIKTKRVKKVIYIGDKYQLSPVEDPHKRSKIYNSKYALQFNLTQVMRQDNPEDNEILDKSVIIREQLDLINDHREKGTYYDMAKGLNIFYNLFRQEENLKHIIVYRKMLNQETNFLEEYFYDSTSKFVITYTNKNVEKFNTIIRNRINNNWQDESAQLLEPGIDGNLYIPRIIPGDNLVFYKTHTVDDSPYHQNNEEVKVISVNLDSISIADLTFGNINTVNANNFIIDTIFFYFIEDHKGKWLRVIHSSSELALSNLLFELSKKAKECKIKHEKRALWDLFWRVEEYFAKVRYAYCGTIHKSQGSTYNNIYIDLCDLFGMARMSIDNLETAFRLTYTAITRPKNNAYILIP